MRGDVTRTEFPMVHFAKSVSRFCKFDGARRGRGARTLFLLPHLPALLPAVPPVVVREYLRCNFEESEYRSISCANMRRGHAAAVGAVSCFARSRYATVRERERERESIRVISRAQTSKSSAIDASSRRRNVSDRECACESRACASAENILTMEQLTSVKVENITLTR